MEPIDAALRDLALQDKRNISEIAGSHDVHRSTLSRRWRGKTKGRDHQIDSVSLLTKQEQKNLVLYINKLTERGIPPTNAMVRNFAHNICGIWPGKN